MRTSHVLTMILLAIAVSGCTKHEPVPPPVVARNPDSTETLSLSFASGEPGYFDASEANATYVITNERDCSPKDNSQALGGRWNHPVEKIDLPVTHIGAGEFHIEAPKRPFLDADYYGLGICRWELSFVQLNTNHRGHTYTVATTAAEMQHKKVRTALCQLSPGEKLSVCTEQASVKLSLRNRYFPVTIKAR